MLRLGGHRRLRWLAALLRVVIRKLFLEVGLRKEGLGWISRRIGLGLGWLLLRLRASFSARLVVEIEVDYPCFLALLRPLHALPSPR